MHGAAEALRRAGLRVNERPGWLGRGRTPGVITPRGILVHDDVIPERASLAARLNVLTYGLPNVTPPGPLCFAGLTKDGTWHLVAAGRANHAGRGAWGGVVDGNGQMLGVECAWYPGEDYPSVQIDSLVRGCAALAEHCGFPASMVAHHREFARPTGRKADMHWHGPLRAQVGLHMLTNAGVVAAEVPWTPARHRRVATVKEDTVQMIELVTPPLDSEGKGWLPLDGFDGRPKVPWGGLVSVLPQGSAPRRDLAYWPVTQVGVQQEANHTLLTVQGGVPSSPTVLYLYVGELS